MNDAEREYTQLIKSIEDEVLNLKTAHQRPLGVLNFFRKTQDITVTSDQYGYVDFNIVVKIATPTVTPPIVQTGWNIPNGFYVVDIYQMSINSNYDTWTYRLALQQASQFTTTLNVSVISSQPIESITRS